MVRRTLQEREDEYKVRNRVPPRPRLALITPQGRFTLLPDTDQSFCVVHGVWIRFAFRNSKGEWTKQTATTEQLIRLAQHHKWQIEISY